MHRWSLCTGGLCVQVALCTGGLCVQVALCTGGLCVQVVFVYRFHCITISTSVAHFVKLSIVIKYPSCKLQYHLTHIQSTVRVELIPDRQLAGVGGTGKVDEKGLEGYCVKILY